MKTKGLTLGNKKSAGLTVVVNLNNHSSAGSGMKRQVMGYIGPRTDWTWANQIMKRM